MDDKNVGAHTARHGVTTTVWTCLVANMLTEKNIQLFIASCLGSRYLYWLHGDGTFKTIFTFARCKIIYVCCKCMEIGCFRTSECATVFIYALWRILVCRRGSVEAVFINCDNICGIWGSHSGDYEEYCLLGYNYMLSVESQPKFQSNILLPSSESINKLSMKPAWSCLPPAFVLVSCFVYSLTLKTETICSSEMLFDFQRAAWC
jgi:hypothetical protein